MLSENPTSEIESQILSEFRVTPDPFSEQKVRWSDKTLYVLLDYTKNFKLNTHPRNSNQGNRVSLACWYSNSVMPITFKGQTHTWARWSQGQRSTRYLRLSVCDRIEKLNLRWVPLLGRDASGINALGSSKNCVLQQTPAPPRCSPGPFSSAAAADVHLRALFLRGTAIKNIAASVEEHQILGNQACLGPY